MAVVSIMDLIMFDAQRQGRLSFYMVSYGYRIFMRTNCAPATENENSNFIIGLCRGRGYSSRIGFSSNPRGCDFCPVSGDRRISTAWLHP